MQVDDHLKAHRKIYLGLSSPVFLATISRRNMFARLWNSHCNTTVKHSHSRRQSHCWLSEANRPQADDTPPGDSLPVSSRIDIIDQYLSPSGSIDISGDWLYELAIKNGRQRRYFDRPTSSSFFWLTDNFSYALQRRDFEYLFKWFKWSFRQHVTR